MDVAIGIGRDLGLSDDQRTMLAVEAAKAGYLSAWTNATGIESLALCERWNREAGIATGIAAVPTLGAEVPELAKRARRLGELSGDKFILGVGIGPAKDLAAVSGKPRPIGRMREHLEGLAAANVPVYLAGVGPQMLQLAGAMADGSIPNYMDPPQIAWARARLDEGARAAGRDPKSVRIAQFVRACVDDDVVAARRAVAKAAFAYALSKPGEPRVGTYYSMTRMGLGPDLDALEERRARGATDDDLADACPDRVLSRLGAWGRAPDVLRELHRLSEGLDIAIVRIVSARPGTDSAVSTIRACAPSRWKTN